MIRIENIESHGWEAAIRGMRNPMNSWASSDSVFFPPFDCTTSEDVTHGIFPVYTDPSVKIGPNDHSLMLKLARAGTDHAKFRRMITVTMDILAPLYWWKEFDTYKVGTVVNSCSTMHKITEKEFTTDDFSFDKINPNFCNYWKTINSVIDLLNNARLNYLNGEEKDKDFWWTIIQLLPSSYNQLRTVQLNYEVLANIYKSRREHKLDEWREFCTMIEGLPYSEIITLQEEN